MTWLLLLVSASFLTGLIFVAGRLHEEYGRTSLEHPSSIALANKKDAAAVVAVIMATLSVLLSFTAGRLW